MNLDLDKIRQLNIQPNAVLLLPDGTDMDTIQELDKAVRKLQPRNKVLYICGMDLLQLNEEEMNAAGWYRT